MPDLVRRLGADGWAWEIVEPAGGGGGDLPAWWTVDSTPGSESVEFAGAVKIAPSAFGADGALRIDAGPSEDYNYAILVQDPLGGSLHPFWVDGAGELQIIPQEAGAVPFNIRSVGGNITMVNVTADGETTLRAGDPAAQVLKLVGLADQTGAMLTIVDNDANELFAAGPTGAVTIAPKDNTIDTLVTINAPTGFGDNTAGAGDLLAIFAEGVKTLELDAYGELFVRATPGVQTAAIYLESEVGVDDEPRLVLTSGGGSRFLQCSPDSGAPPALMVTARGFLCLRDVGDAPVPGLEGLDPGMVLFGFDADDATPALVLAATTADGTLASATIPLTPAL